MSISACRKAAAFDGGARCAARSRCAHERQLPLAEDPARGHVSLPYVSSFLTHDSVKIQAKALWLLGEMGLEHPTEVEGTVPMIASFLDSPKPLFRERAVNALGRIGRGNYPLIESYWPELFRFASDEAPKVRLAFIRASENIATNTPDIYEN